MDNLDLVIARQAFERLASDPTFKFKRGTNDLYLNPAVRRDWKWFVLGYQFAEAAEDCEDDDDKS